MDGEMIEDCKEKTLAMVRGFIENHKLKSTRHDVDFIHFGDADTSGRLYFSTSQCGFMGMWVLVYLMLSLGGRGQRPKFYIDLKAVQFRPYYRDENPRDDRLETFENIGESNEPEKVSRLELRTQ
jgi:hypothetical protein